MKTATFFFVLLLGSLVLIACGAGEDNDCFRAKKQNAGDIRIHLPMDGGPAGLTAAFSIEPGPNSSTPRQSKACFPVKNDIASPTNVVFQAAVGDVVKVGLSGGGLTDGTHEVACKVTDVAYQEPDQGTPGNVFFDLFLNFAGGSRYEPTLVCGVGFDFAPV